MDLATQLMRDEGVRLMPYQDTVGKWTIGVGRNLTDVGISVDEAQYLLTADIKRASAALQPYAWFTALDDVRQGAVLNMCFNLGAGGLLHFPHMIAALARQDWATASQEMLNSTWAVQVGARAQRLAQQILTGAWQ